MPGVMCCLGWLYIGPVGQCFWDVKAARSDRRSPKRGWRITESQGSASTQNVDIDVLGVGNEHVCRQVVGHEVSLAVRTFQQGSV